MVNVTAPVVSCGRRSETGQQVLEVGNANLPRAECNATGTCGDRHVVVDLDVGGPHVDIAAVRVDAAAEGHGIGRRAVDRGAARIAVMAVDGQIHCEKGVE